MCSNYSVIETADKNKLMAWAKPIYIAQQHNRSGDSVTDYEDMQKQGTMLALNAHNQFMLLR